MSQNRNHNVFRDLTPPSFAPHDMTPSPNYPSARYDMTPSPNYPNSTHNMTPSPSYQNVFQHMSLQQQQLAAYQMQMNQQQLMMQRGFIHPNSISPQTVGPIFQPPLIQFSPPAPVVVPQARNIHPRDGMHGNMAGMLATRGSTPSAEDINRNSVPGNLNGMLAAMGLNQRENSPQNYPVEQEHNAEMERLNNMTSTLYTQQGICKWPACETICENRNDLLMHMRACHNLDNRSAAQTRMQAQVVHQLESQLQSERDRLNAMMNHLHSVNQQVRNVTNDIRHRMNSERREESPRRLRASNDTITSTTTAVNASPVTTRSHPRTNRQRPNRNHLNTSRANDTSIMIGGIPYMIERAGIDLQQEVSRNREFYKSADVRPPFTYASLIRQSIIESRDKQLTLNEIYNWFQNTFCYFRHNAATWKNAIRTNLSLHKCFVRYEDDFGSFWMVDDAEFVKRRHLSRGRPRKYEPLSPSPNTYAQQGPQGQRNPEATNGENTPVHSIQLTLEEQRALSLRIANETNQFRRTTQARSGSSRQTRQTRKNASKRNESRTKKEKEPAKGEEAAEQPGCSNVPAEHVQQSERQYSQPTGTPPIPAFLFPSTTSQRHTYVGFSHPRVMNGEGSMDADQEVAQDLSMSSR